MAINLERFAHEVEVIVPIVEGWGQINTRKIYQPGLENGWYVVGLNGVVNVKRKATPLEIDKALRDIKPLRVFAYGEEGIPLNFSNFFQRGLGQSVKVHFLNQQPFTLVKVILWEDNRLYYWENDIRTEREVIKSVQQAFEADQPITEIKGVTPELRYYYLLLNLQRQHFRHLEELERLKLDQEEQKKRMEEFRNTFAGRLQHVIEQAGGTLVKFNKSRGNSYMVHWKIGDQLVKSQISDDLSVVSAGFCLSGDDRRHTMQSIVQLADMFQERSPLYITRE